MAMEGGERIYGQHPEEETVQGGHLETGNLYKVGLHFMYTLNTGVCMQLL